MKFAVLGGGRMGSALVKGMIASGFTTGDNISISAATVEEAAQAASLLGTHAAASNDEALRDADVAFLCVKPGQSLGVVTGAARQLQGKLLISIVAGIHAEDLFQAAGRGIRVIRTMPNTAVRLRKGIIAISRHETATPQDLDLALRIFSSVGTALEVREKDLDAVTAVSGSGPAFALLMLESLAQGGVEGGLDPETARICAGGAIAAAASLVMETGESPLALRAEITSPGGTTEAGLKVLVDADFPAIVRDAVNAARHRSMELSATT
jgi:pyrroline-5-carboxylate reductase